MRIALYHNTPSGGAKRAIYEWTRRLAVSHEIDVYTLSTADHDYCDIRPYVNQHQTFEFNPRGLFESPLGRLNQMQRWRDLGELQRIGRVIADKINAGGYDVVFANTCFYTFMPTCMSWLNVPSIYYLHEPFGPKFVREFDRPYLQNNGWRETVNRVDPLIKLYQHRLAAIQLEGVRNTRRLLANSHFTRDNMKMAYGVDTPICHYGVNLENFTPMPEVSKENFLISVGEMRPRKGFDFLIKSLRYIPSLERPKLVLVSNMVDLKERNYLENLATKYNVELELLTSLNASQLAVLYNQARLCVYAPVAEPFGLVPLEAMACGTPVVGVREGGVLESVVHEYTGLLVERDPGLFATAVQQLLSNPTLAAQFGRNGRQHVLQNWTWDESASRLGEHLFGCGIEYKGGAPEPIHSNVTIS